MSGELTSEIKEIQEQDVIDFCKKKGWMIVRYKYCSCDVFIDPELIPGYEGDSNLGCGHCADRCPRCKQPSCCIEYSSTGISDKYGEVCYGCAIGDCGSEYSSNESIQMKTYRFKLDDVVYEFEEDEYADKYALLKVADEKVYDLGLYKVGEDFEITLIKDEE